MKIPLGCTSPCKAQLILQRVPCCLQKPDPSEIDLQALRHGRVKKIEFIRPNFLSACRVKLTGERIKPTTNACRCLFIYAYAHQLRHSPSCNQRSWMFAGGFQTLKPKSRAQRCCKPSCECTWPDQLLVVTSLEVREH